MLHVLIAVAELVNAFVAPFLCVAPVFWLEGVGSEALGGPRRLAGFWSQVLSEGDLGRI